MDGPWFVAYLALQGAVFAAWAVQAFAVLFHLRRRAIARTGRVWNGPLVMIAVGRVWLHEPDQSGPRRRLILLTLALLVLSAGFAAIAS